MTTHRPEDADDEQTEPSPHSDAELLAVLRKARRDQPNQRRYRLTGDPRYAIAALADALRDQRQPAPWVVEWFLSASTQILAPGGAQQGRIARAFGFVKKYPKPETVNEQIDLVQAVNEYRFTGKPLRKAIAAVARDEGIPTHRVEDAVKAVVLERADETRFWRRLAREPGDEITEYRDIAKAVIRKRTGGVSLARATSAACSLETALRLVATQKNRPIHEIRNAYGWGTTTDERRRVEGLTSTRGHHQR